MSKELENTEKEYLLGEISNLKLQNKQIESQKDSLQSKVNYLQSKANYLQFQLDQYKRMVYGSKRERFIPDADKKQMRLPFDVEPLHEAEEEEKTITYKRKTKKRMNHPGRMPLPDHLPVEEIIIEPQEDTSDMKCIGKEVTDKLEVIPAKLFIKRYIRNKYIKMEGGIGLEHKGVIAPLPTFAIEKGIAGSGLLAQIIIDKFIDHLPIYRQIERFKRENIKLSSSTINGWQESVCNLLEPLYQTLKHRVLSQGYLQVDETPINVLDKNKKKNIFRGYHWIYYSPLEKTVLFDFREGRSARGLTILLKDFKGYLQTDGYAVYDKFGKQKSITLLNCMAHARRGFEKALKNKNLKAEYAMKMFGKLYDVERKAREQNLTPEQRHRLRLDESLPVLNEFGKWIAETRKQTLPKSSLGEALTYCTNRWDGLNNYLIDGSLEIDNNPAESAIRPIAVGKKNYLFAGSSRGAERAAMFYSFFGTCKKNNVNPFMWLKKVLDIIPDYKANKLEDLLPQNLKLDMEK